MQSVKDWPDGRVVEMISILKEFVMGVSAKLYRHMDENGIDEHGDSFEAVTARHMSSLYNKVLELDTMEAVHIMLGKVQIINEIIKDITQDE